MDQDSTSTSSSSNSSIQKAGTQNAVMVPLTPPLTLRVVFRYDRLALLTTTAVAFILLFVGVFGLYGQELVRFKSTDKTSSQQSQLLDQYNSYSGSLAAVFGTPIELFAAVSVQLIALRFLTTATLQPDPSWKLAAGTLLATAGAQFLISNGFNALNVQIHPLGFQAIISKSDLSVISNFSTSLVATKTSNLNQTFSEQTPQNPITNTLLRNLVLPPVPSKQTQCSWQNTEFESFGFLPETVLEYGFPQRDWHATMLQHALAPQTLRVVVNPTNKTVKNQSQRLPMNASRAADLFLYGMAFAPYFLPWANSSAYLDQIDLAKRYPPAPSPETYANEIASVATGLLPPASDEPQQQQDWFLKKSTAALHRFFKNAANTSQANLVMEFSHVQIAPTISFDAITFEAKIDPPLLATASSTSPSTSYTNLQLPRNCGPWPTTSPRCLIEKFPYSVDTIQYDAAPQVQTLAICMDANGSEKLRASISEFQSVHLLCNQSSHNSLLVVSISKKLVADKLQQNVWVSTSTEPAEPAESDGGGDILEENQSAAVVTNLDKFFSITIGRLGWDSENLATKFHATCDSTTKGTATGCDGLYFPLEPPLTSSSSAAKASPKQYLVVDNSALPLELLGKPDFLTRPRFLPLARIHEPHTREQVDPRYNSAVGDLLLPHNVKEIHWGLDDIHKPFNAMSCDAKLEDRVARMLNNHLYMEHGLQPAYTAAMFFLFQNGVVKDTVARKAIGTNNQQTTLAFDKNFQEMAVWISIPHVNAWLTLVGCLVVFSGLVAVVVKNHYFTGEKGDPLHGITQPSVIARVLLASDQFPSLLLGRHVLDPSATDKKKEKESFRDVDGFVIDSLSLKRTQEEVEDKKDPQVVDGSDVANAC